MAITPDVVLFSFSFFIFQFVVWKLNYIFQTNTLTIVNGGSTNDHSNLQTLGRRLLQTLILAIVMVDGESKIHHRSAKDIAIDAGAGAAAGILLLRFIPPTSRFFFSSKMESFEVGGLFSHFHPLLDFGL